MEVLELGLWLSQSQDLSDGDPVLAIENLVSPYQLPAVLLKLLAAVGESHSLLCGRGDCDLNRLVVLDTDVVSLSELVLRLVGHLRVGALGALRGPLDVLLNDALQAVVLLAVGKLLLHLAVEAVDPVLRALVPREAPVSDRAVVLVGDLPVREPVLLALYSLRVLFGLFDLGHLSLELQLFELLEGLEIVLVELLAGALQLHDLRVLLLSGLLPMDELPLGLEYLLLDDLVLLVDEPVVVGQPRDDLLETVLVLEARLVPGERAHSRLQVLDLGLQDLVLGREPVRALGVERGVLEALDVLLDVA